MPHFQPIRTRRHNADLILSKNVGHAMVRLLCHHYIGSHPSLTNFTDDTDDARRYEGFSYRFSGGKGYIKLRLPVFEGGMSCMKDSIAVLDYEPLSNARRLDMRDKTAFHVVQLIDCLPLDRVSLGNSL